MSGELDDYEEELTEVLEQVEGVLEREIGKMRGQERLEKCAYLKNRIARAKKVHRSIIVEIRELPPGSGVAAEWENKQKTYLNRINKLQQDIEWAETSAERDDMKRKANVEEMTAKEITQTAIVIQEQTQQSTTRAKRMVEETMEMGLAVRDEVQKQGQQMSKIQEDLATVESNLTRAEKQVRVFLRRMATDKIFIVFIMLIVILVVVAIVLFVLKQKNIINIGTGGISIPKASPAPTPP
ncbi:hypothetical protein DFS34DRAFT_653284 [Phlyctochytrium arcticum]|nr:hypothetical protein DFS34DRAFT_653284 [Phlyctochytrium arcticum]